MPLSAIESVHTKPSWRGESLHELERTSAFHGALKIVIYKKGQVVGSTPGLFRRRPSSPELNVLFPIYTERPSLGRGHIDKAVRDRQIQRSFAFRFVYCMWDALMRLVSTRNTRKASMVSGCL